MILRGDIFYADLGERVGSEQSGIRPVLVVQNDMGNRYASTLIVAPMTSRHKKPLPTHIYLPGGACDNLAPSTVLTEQLTTIDVSRLLAYVGFLAPEYMRRVDESLLVSFGLTVHFQKEGFR